MRTRTPRAAAPTLAAALIATFPHLALAQDARTGDAGAPSMETADVLQDDPVIAENAAPGPDADADAAPTEDPGRTATRTTSPVATSDAAVADAAGEATRRLEENAADPVAEAAEALDLTAEAVRALAGEDPRSALPLVEDAVGRLEVLIARRPSLVLAPADTEVLERDLFAALPTVEALRERIEHLVDDDRIQEARELMRDFGS